MVLFPRRIYRSVNFWFMLLCFTASVYLACFQLPDSLLHVYFCDVGQGDALVIRYRNQTVLVDGGPDRAVLTCLDSALPFWERDIDLVVLSHPHADHISGLIHVLDHYSVRRALLGFSPYSSEIYSAFLDGLLKDSIPTIKAVRGQTVVFEPFSLEVYWPPASCSQSDANYCSVVLNLQYKDFSALLTGDLTEEAQEDFLISSSFEFADVLKVPHQGARDSLSTDLISQVNPAVAVISVGLHNRFGHPHEETLHKLLEHGVILKRTDLDGPIEVISDGVSWYIR